MDSVFFSVLIPVYNVEKYLDRCIKSVIEQGFKDFELILIDDGSTDNSGMICDLFRQKDTRIKVVHKKNEGLMMTRRMGISLAQGEYLVFLDSDDFWVKDALQIIYDNICKHQCELLIYNYVKQGVNSSDKNVGAFRDESIFEQYNRREFLMVALGKDKVNSMWVKAVKRSLMERDKTKYKEYAKLIHSGEDIFQSIPLYFLAEKIVYIDKPLVNYNVAVPTSITSSFNIKKFDSMEVVYNRKISYLDEYGYYDDKIIEQISITMLNKLVNLLLRNICDLKINRTNKVKIIREIFERKWIYRLFDTIKIRNIFEGNNLIIYLLKHKKYYLVYSYMNLYKRCKRSS